MQSSFPLSVARSIQEGLVSSERDHSVLHQAGRLLCRLSNDFLLPTMITFLNDRDWQTRAAFFREVPCMAAQAGFAGMEAFLLPCVEQASFWTLKSAQRLSMMRTGVLDNKDRRTMPAGKLLQGAGKDWRCSVVVRYSCRSGIRCQV